MKRLILKENKDTIEFGELGGRELVAYRTKGDNGYVATLSRLEHHKFGFINLGYSNTAPTYVANYWHEAIQKAAKSCTLYVFNNYDQLVQAIAHDLLTPVK